MFPFIIILEIDVQQSVNTLVCAIQILFFIILCQRTNLGVSDSSYSEPNVDPDDDAAAVTVYRAVLWVFANISGLITFLPDGTIHSINENFSLILFGYPREELVGKVGYMLLPLSSGINSYFLTHSHFCGFFRFAAHFFAANSQFSLFVPHMFFSS